jgi:hypothetical protein
MKQKYKKTASGFIDSAFNIIVDQIIQAAEVKHVKG